MFAWLQPPSARGHLRHATRRSRHRATSGWATFRCARGPAGPGDLDEPSGDSVHGSTPPVSSRSRSSAVGPRRKPHRRALAARCPIDGFGARKYPLVVAQDAPDMAYKLVAYDGSGAPQAPPARQPIWTQVFRKLEHGVFCGDTSASTAKPFPGTCWCPSCQRPTHPACTHIDGARDQPASRDRRASSLERRSRGHRLPYPGGGQRQDRGELARLGARRHGRSPPWVQRRQRRLTLPNNSSSSLDFDCRRIESLPLPRVPEGQGAPPAEHEGQTPPTQAGWTLSLDKGFSRRSSDVHRRRAVRLSTDGANREAREARSTWPPTRNVHAARQTIEPGWLYITAHRRGRVGIVDGAVLIHVPGECPHPGSTFAKLAG